MNDIAIRDLKPLMYNILSSLSSNNNDGIINATQNMGVSLTNAVKKEGVNIIQVQNVNYESIIPKLIEAMQMIDNLEFQSNSALIDSNIEVIECTPQDTYDPEEITELFIEYIIENNINYKKACNLLKVRMYKTLMERSKNQKEALSRLGLSRASVYQSMNKLKEDGNNDNT